MQPVSQKYTSGEKSDCLRACVASILELDRCQVPNFARSSRKGFETQLSYARDFVQGYGFDLVEVPIERAPTGYSILLDEEHHHAVVGKDGELDFDPFPEEHDVPLSYSACYVFAASDPAQMINAGSMDAG